MEQLTLAEEILARGEPLVDVPALRGLPYRKSRPRHGVLELKGFEVEIQFPVGTSVMENFGASDYRKAGRQIHRTVVATVRKAGTAVGTIEMTHDRHGPLLHARPWGAAVGPCGRQLRETLQLFFTDLQTWKDVPDAAEAITTAHMEAQVLRDARGFPTFPGARALHHPSAAGNAQTAEEPGRSMPKQALWWSDKPEERFWVEITQRPDIGADLKAPQGDKGGKLHHAYSLIAEVQPGDIVFHCNNNVRAIVGVSRVAGSPFPANILWSSLADGSDPFDRPGWKVPLEKYTALTPPFGTDEFIARQAAIQAAATANLHDSRQALHGPFQLKRQPMRMAQAYLTKVPNNIVAMFPGLARAAANLVGDLPSPEVPPPPRLGQAYLPADETTSTQPSEPFAQDPDVVDRGRRGHAKTQNLLANTVKAQGHEPRRPAAGEPGFDLAWEVRGHVYASEVKSLTPLNEERQLRLGLGQVLRYRQQLARPGRKVTAVLAVERKPTDPAWQALCQELGVILLWPETMATLAKTLG
ncbi:MAG: hypothetical protein QOI63_758 [Thermoplasmata archaeon]|nr:hypothetical protein [Thermoplasmata archaeon]